MLNWFGRPSWYLGFFTCAWGLVSALTALVNNFGGMVACRFILGCVGQFSFASVTQDLLVQNLILFSEAPFFPGVLFYLSVSSFVIGARA